jgi:serine-type D-Ala-D-Ala carboxypeptidase (penicillin-binding protein 5/6)
MSGFQQINLTKKVSNKVIKKSWPQNSQYYLLSIFLVVLSGIFVASIPLVAANTQKNLVGSSLEIPKNNSQVAGVQKYNYPPISKDIQSPSLSARAVFVKDLTTETILFQKNANSRVPIASTTKIMTAIVSSEYFKPNSVLTVNQGATIPGSTVGLSAGEQLSFRSLLYGMLLNSGNDAAFTIAENYPGGVVGFVQAMNNKAAQLKLENTHFENPAGFDNANHYSSAADLGRITQEALKSAELSRIFATKDTSVTSLDKTRVHKLVNLNKLLTNVKGVLGVKTGYTDLAKENLVGLVERDNHRILTVVLGSDDRFAETTDLMEWVYTNFYWND